MLKLVVYYYSSFKTLSRHCDLQQAALSSLPLMFFWITSCKTYIIMLLNIIIIFRHTPNFSKVSIKSAGMLEMLGKCLFNVILAVAPYTVKKDVL